ncbi:MULTISPECIES: SDR family oxidoreductase [Oceanobacillus]|uniref:3-ketoacyl-ACP reductase n=1 Tax=Oceanobacillus kimchii TaxID=746691 RepID=A0ABQ5TKB3_9BACI|nr:MULTISPECIES: SDR family oxidoreductase [Oceanobacillus]MBT2598646.1 SDR family oxidoreductase [Oceanobacillus sp. ISL-74]MBT2651565.1 SDR family oxidoreductase [Oceanobacillus sp. ISL-73]OEH54723.1 3-ketoacyl-ACP reductase [Oceanobacillus sp. E9]GLO66058.1 3-ketoacyl-ACP reductase [Oceanobacillus kimchii]
MRGNVLVIGASGEIGIAIALKLAREGYSLLLHYHQNVEPILQLQLELNEDAILGFYQADLSTNDGIHHLINQLDLEIDGIVFAGGNAHFNMFQESLETEMDEMLHLHVKAPWMITKHLLPNMIRKNKGHIVFITSIWGDRGASNEVMYSSVKGAQNSFVRALAKEVSLSGISVNGVSPGFIQTKMNAHLSAEEVHSIIEEIPLNRAGLPEEVANAVHFLISDQSSYIRGEIIEVNGAW